MSTSTMPIGVRLRVALRAYVRAEDAAIAHLRFTRDLPLDAEARKVQRDYAESLLLRLSRSGSVFDTAEAEQILAEVQAHPNTDEALRLAVAEAVAA